MVEIDCQEKDCQYNKLCDCRKDKIVFNNGCLSKFKKVDKMDKRQIFIHCNGDCVNCFCNKYPNMLYCEKMEDWIGEK